MSTFWGTDQKSAVFLCQRCLPKKQKRSKITRVIPKKEIFSMTLKSYVWGIRFLTFISLSALGFVVFHVDPEKSGFFGKVIFYSVLFFFLSGTLNLFLIFTRRKIMGSEAALANMGLSFRQSILLSVLAIILLIFQSFRMLVWWDGLLAVAAVFLIELYFLSRN